MLYKYCGACKILKEISNYSYNKSTSDKYNANCKECEKLRLKKYYEEIKK